MTDTKFKQLKKILEKIISDFPSDFIAENIMLKQYEQAMSRAFIHLLLKAGFGILEFEDRELNVTDGRQDGGIDAYFIDSNKKTIYFIQAKFHKKHGKFENKGISYKELLAMDVDRILSGETEDCKGNAYNEKIIKMQTEINKAKKINPGYEHKVIILANTFLEKTDLTKVTGGCSCEVFDFNKVYNDLILPVVKGSYYYKENLTITLNLSDKEKAAEHIEYKVSVRGGECAVRIMFVPVEEIARILSKYRNTILKYNPRSYLGLKKNKVNEGIKNSIATIDTNEFALYNNGITFLATKSYFDNQTGIKNKGILKIDNPQIINGGQTAYTLSAIYDGSIIGMNEESLRGKEVLVKLIDTENILSNEPDFIESISRYTNKQTEVKDSDRRSNDSIQINLQERIYNEFGLFYERKDGEFYDALEAGYIERETVINKFEFLRIAYASLFPLIELNPRNITKPKLFEDSILDFVFKENYNLNKIMFSYRVLMKLKEVKRDVVKNNKSDKYLEKEYGRALRYGDIAVVTVISYLYYEEDWNKSMSRKLIQDKIIETLARWKEFEEFALKKSSNSKYFSATEVEYNYAGYYKGKTLNEDLFTYFKNE